MKLTLMALLLTSSVQLFAAQILMPVEPVQLTVEQQEETYQRLCIEQVNETLGDLGKAGVSVRHVYVSDLSKLEGFDLDYPGIAGYQIMEGNQTLFNLSLIGSGAEQRCWAIYQGDEGDEG